MLVRVCSLGLEFASCGLLGCRLVPPAEAATVFVRVPPAETASGPPPPAAAARLSQLRLPLSSVVRVVTKVHARRSRIRVRAEPTAAGSSPLLQLLHQVRPVVGGTPAHSVALFLFIGVIP